jgi:hypothetical protein
MCKVFCSLLVLVISVSVVLAEEIRGIITKVDGDKVTFVKGTFNKETKKFEKGEPQTLPVADSVKVVKGKFNKETKKTEAGDPIEGGLKNDMFTKIGEKGVFATIVTDADNKKITEIRVSAGFKKKKDAK